MHSNSSHPLNRASACLLDPLSGSLLERSSRRHPQREEIKLQGQVADVVLLLASMCSWEQLCQRL